MAQIEDAGGVDLTPETTSTTTNYKLNIPAGRQVVITSNGNDIFNSLQSTTPGLALPVQLIMTEGVTLKISSQYKNLVEAQSSTMLNLISGLTKGVVPSGQFGLQGLQIWESTDVLDFSLTCELHMATSGRADVVLPALALSKICVPSYNKSGISAGWGLIPPGPSLKDILGLVKATLDKTDDFGNRQISKDPKQGGGLLGIKIGKYLNINNIVVTKVEPTFSEILDEDYMPVSCKLNIDFRTVEVVTTDMLDKIITNLGK